MHVFVAGGTGVLGRRIVPRLRADGHRVTVLARRPERAARAAELGAVIAAGDALDAQAVATAMRAASPDVVMHQLTDLAGGSFAGNSRLRIDGTRNLVDAARACGVRRIVVQSISWVYEPGDAPADEQVPLDRVSTGDSRRRTVDAVIAMESCAGELPEAVVLRNGLLYGPGTWYAPDGLVAERARRAELPMTADVASFVHVDDAAVAAVLALSWPAGAVNIVDDEPAPESRWLPAFCDAVGAPPPRADDRPRTPFARGASNARARRLGWSPVWPSWRAGFAAMRG